MKQTVARRHRLSLVDILLLASACAVGFAITEWIFGWDAQTQQLLSVSGISTGLSTYEHAVYGIVIGMALGGPFVLGVQYLRGRKGLLTIGESLWLVSLPLYGILLAASHLLLAMRASGEYSFRVYCGWIFAQLLFSLCSALYLFVIAVSESRNTHQWTDIFGPVVCMLVGGLLMYDGISHLSFP